MAKYTWKRPLGWFEDNEFKALFGPYDPARTFMITSNLGLTDPFIAIDRDTGVMRFPLAIVGQYNFEVKTYLNGTFSTADEIEIIVEEPSRKLYDFTGMSGVSGVRRVDHALTHSAVDPNTNNNLAYLGSNVSGTYDLSKSHFDVVLFYASLNDEGKLIIDDIPSGQTLTWRQFQRTYDRLLIVVRDQETISYENNEDLEALGLSINNDGGAAKTVTITGTGGGGAIALNYHTSADFGEALFARLNSGEFSYNGSIHFLSKSGTNRPSVDVVGYGQVVVPTGIRNKALPDQEISGGGSFTLGDDYYSAFAKSNYAIVPLLADGSVLPDGIKFTIADPNGIKFAVDNNAIAGTYRIRVSTFDSDVSGDLPIDVAAFNLTVSNTNFAARVGDNGAPIEIGTRTVAIDSDFTLDTSVFFNKSGGSVRYALSQELTYATLNAETGVLSGRFSDVQPVEVVLVAHTGTERAKVTFTLKPSNSFLEFDRGTRTPLRDDEDFPITQTEDSPNRVSPTLSDIDGDGDLDLILAGNAGKFALYLNDGAGVFSADATLDKISSNSAYSSLVDFDGDGDLDLVLLSGTSKYLVRFENVDGSFNRSSNINIPYLGRGIAFVDADRDGDQDLVIGVHHDGALKYYENTAGPNVFMDLQERYGNDNPFHGIRVTRSSFKNAGDFSALSFVDVDADGDLDFFFGDGYSNNSYSGQILYYRNDGGFGFTPQENANNPLLGFKTGSRTTTAFGDINGDGAPDLVLAVGKDLFLIKGIVKQNIVYSFLGYRADENKVSVVPDEGSQTIRSRDFGSGQNVISLGDGADTIASLSSGFDFILVYVSRDDMGHLVLDDVPADRTETWAGFELGKDRIVFVMREEGTFRIADQDTYEALNISVVHSTSGFTIAGVGNRTIKVAYTGTLDPSLAGVTTPLTLAQLETAFGISLDFVGQEEIAVPGFSRSVPMISHDLADSNYVVPADYFWYDGKNDLEVTYTATLADGAALPVGAITFNSATRTFSAVDATVFSAHQVKLTGSIDHDNDPTTATLVTSDVFDLTIGDIPPARTISLKTDANGTALEIPPFLVEPASDFTLETRDLFSGSKNHATYRVAQGTNQYPITIDPNTGIVSGHFFGTHPFKVTIIAEVQGASAEATFTIQATTRSDIEFDTDNKTPLKNEEGFPVTQTEDSPTRISPAIGLFPKDLIEDLDPSELPNDYAGDIYLLLGNNVGNLSLSIVDLFGNILFRSYGVSGTISADIYPGIVDYNGNGYQDIILINRSDAFLIQYNPIAGGSYTFERGANITFSYSGRGLAFGDIDGDGDQDLVVGAHDGSLKYFENTAGANAAITLQERTGSNNPFDGIGIKRPAEADVSFMDSGEFSALSLIDVDADGDLDFFLGDGYADEFYFGEILYYRNDGTAGFTLQANAHNPLFGFETGGRTTTAFGDINGDGVTDLVLALGKDLFLIEGIAQQDIVYSFLNYRADENKVSVVPDEGSQTIRSRDLGSGQNVISLGDGADTIASLSSGFDFILVYVSRDDMGHLVLDDVPADRTETWAGFELGKDRIVFVMREAGTFRVADQAEYEALNISVVRSGFNFTIAGVGNRTIEVASTGTLDPSLAGVTTPLTLAQLETAFGSSIDFVGQEEIAVPGFSRSVPMISYDLAVSAFEVPADYFWYDGKNNLEVTYSATLADGAALPVGAIAFNSATRTFSAVAGAPLSSHTVKLTGSIDHDNDPTTVALVTSDVFDLTIGDIPPARTISLKTDANGTALEIPPFSVEPASDFTLETRDLFSGSKNHATYRLAQGTNQYPITIDPNTGIVSGHFFGTHPFKVTIIAEVQGASAEATFTIQATTRSDIEFDTDNKTPLRNKDGNPITQTEDSPTRISPAIGLFPKDLIEDLDPSELPNDYAGDIYLLLGNNVGNLSHAVVTPFGNNLFGPYGVSGTISAGIYPGTVDYNGNGYQDIILINRSDAFLIQYNPIASKDPAFERGTNITFSYSGRGLAFGDIDGDGDQDLVVGAHDGSLKYFENTAGANAAITLQERTGSNNPFDGIGIKRPAEVDVSFMDSGEFSALSLIDVDADGDLDFFLGDGYSDDSYSGEILYYRNDGTAGFTLQANANNPLFGFKTGSRTTTSFGDINGDGVTDLVLAVGTDLFLIEGIVKQDVVYSFLNYRADENKVSVVPDEGSQTIRSRDLSSGQNVISLGDGVDTIASLSNGFDFILVYVSRDDMGHLVLDDVPADRTETWAGFELGKDRIVFVMREAGTFRVADQAAYEALNISVVHSTSGFTIAGVGNRTIKVAYTGTLDPSLAGVTTPLTLAQLETAFGISLDFVGQEKIAVPGFSRSVPMISHDLSDSNYVVPADYFLYDGKNDREVTYTATLADGAALPAGAIAFNSATRTFSAVVGAPLSSDTVKLTGSIDHDNDPTTAALTHSGTLELVISSSPPALRFDNNGDPIDFGRGVYQSPSTLASPLSIDLASFFTPGLSTTSPQFTISDLPPGLRFEATTGVISGTFFLAKRGQVHNLPVTVTNSDGSFSDTFTIKLLGDDLGFIAYNFGTFTTDGDTRFVGDTADTNNKIITSADLSTHINVIYPGEGTDTIRSLSDGVDIIIVYGHQPRGGGQYVLEDVPENTTETWAGFELGKDRIVFVRRDPYLSVDPNLSVTHDASTSTFTIVGVEGRTIEVAYTGTADSSLTGVTTPLTFAQLETAFGSDIHNNFDFVIYRDIGLPGFVDNSLPGLSIGPGNGFNRFGQFFVYDGVRGGSSFSLTLADGGALPAGLSFVDSASGGRLGVASDVSPAVYSLEFTAHFGDSPPKSFTSTFNLAIDNPLDYKTGISELGDIAVILGAGEEQTFSLSSSFTDTIPNSIRIYSVDSVLPEGVHLSRGGLLSVYSWVAGGESDINLTVTNGVETITDTFTLNITGIPVGFLGIPYQFNNIGWATRQGTVGDDVLTGSSTGTIFYPNAGRDTVGLDADLNMIIVYAHLDSAERLILADVPTGDPEVWNNFTFGDDRIIFAVRGEKGLDLFETQADYDARGLSITRGSDGGDHILVSDVSGRVIRINYTTSSLPSEFIDQSAIEFDDLSALFDVRNVATGVDTITQRLNFDVVGYDQIALSTSVVNHPFEFEFLSATDSYTLPEDFMTFVGVNATSYTVTGSEAAISFDATMRVLTLLEGVGDGNYPITITGQNSDGDSFSLATTVLYNIQPPRLTSEESFGSSKVFNTGQAIFGSAQEGFTFTDEGEVTIKIAAGTATKVGAVEIGRGYTKIAGDHGVLTAYSLNGKVKWTYTLNDDADYSTRYEDQFTVFAISEGGIETLLADGALTIDITTSEVTKVVADRTGFKSVVIDESAVSDDKVVLGGDSNDEIIAGTGRDVVSGGRGIDRLILSSDTVADTVVYAFDARVPQGWTAYDGADTISGFDLGTDKLTLQARVDGTTPVDFFDQFANANIRVQLLLSGASNNMVDGVMLSFVASGDGYGGISAGNSLTIKFATAVRSNDVISKIGGLSNYDFNSRTVENIIKDDVNVLDTLLRGTDSGDAGDHFDVVSAIVSNSAPSGVLSITGDAVGGSTLVVDQGTLADADGLGVISYQWVRFDVDTQQIVNDGTGAGYTITSRNIGDFIRVIATYKDDGGTDESIISDAVRIGSPATPNIESDAALWLADDSITLLPDDAHLPPVDIL